MQCPKAALFDMDETLAESFKDPEPDTVERLRTLAAYLPIAIVTGRAFEAMARTFLPLLTASVENGRLFIFSEAAAQGFVYDGSWQTLYSESLSEEEKRLIRAIIEQVVDETKLLDGLPLFGEQFTEKKGSIAFSALGRGIPMELRYSWDPGNVRRAALTEALAAKLPQYDVLMGGATTIDVNKKGVNKTRAISWLSEHLQVSPQEMLYVGDALYPGGNDYVVIATGVQTKQTSGVPETQLIINELLSSCSAR